MAYKSAGGSPGAERQSVGLGGGGFGSRAQDRDNPFDSRLRNTRYQQSPGVARPGTWDNFGRLAGLAAPGGSLITGGQAAINGTFDPFSGPMAPHTNFSYDAADRGMGQAANLAAMSGLNGVGQRSLWRQKLAQQQARGNPLATSPAAPVNPFQAMGQQTYGPTQLSVGGGMPYNVTIPQWSYYR